MSKTVFVAPYFALPFPFARREVMHELRSLSSKFVNLRHPVVVPASTVDIFNAGNVCEDEDDVGQWRRLSQRGQREKVEKGSHGVYVWVRTSSRQCYLPLTPSQDMSCSSETFHYVDIHPSLHQAR